MSSKIAGISEQIVSKAAEIAKLASELSTLEKTKAVESDTALSQWLARIHDDQMLTNLEFQQLRDEADFKLDALKALYSEQGEGLNQEGVKAPSPESVDLDTFQKAADEVVQQMQVGILRFKKKHLPKEAQANVKEAYAFQVAYIHACLDRFTQML